MSGVRRMTWTYTLEDAYRFKPPVEDFAYFTPVSQPPQSPQPIELEVLKKRHNVKYEITMTDWGTNLVLVCPRGERKGYTLFTSQEEITPDILDMVFRRFTS